MFWTRHELESQFELQGNTLVYYHELNHGNEDKFNEVRTLMAQSLEQKCFCNITEVDI